MADVFHNHESVPAKQSTAPPALTIRLMQDQDVDECLAIFRDHGLPEAAHGLRTYRAVCPDGCYVAVNQETGEVIAMCIGNTYDPRAAFIGYYGVKVGFQGLGIGLKVWKEVMKFLGPERNIGLCSSPSQIATYRDKAGFVIQDASQMVVYDSHSSTINQIAPTGHDSLEIQVLPTTDCVDELIAFDETVIGMNREELLRLSLKEPDTVSFVAVDPKNKKMLGYGAMRSTNYNDRRPMLAPLYAASYNVAKVLLYNLMINVPDSMEHGYICFVLDSNADATRLAEATGLKPHFGAPRLFTKETVTGADVTKVFAILSPDFAPY